MLDMQRLGTQDLPKPNVMSSAVTLEANPSRETLLRMIEEAKDRFRGPDQNETNIREAFLGFVEEAARAWGITLPREKRCGQWLQQFKQRSGRSPGRHWRGAGQEGQTAMIVRLATQKFGEAAGNRLAALLALADNTDSDSGRMDQIARAILDCKTSDELFAKVLA